MKKILRIILIFILQIYIITILSCHFSDNMDNEFIFEEFPLEEFPEQKDYPDAGAVILLDEAEINILKTGKLRSSHLDRRMVVKILNKKGYKYATMIIPYAEGTYVTNIRAKTILKNGKVIPLDKDQIFDVNLYPSFILYSDIRAKRFTMPGIEDDCIVEYKWTQKTESFTYWTRWFFQHDEPTMINRYTVRCLSQWDIKWKAYGLEVEPEKDDYPDGFKAVSKWEVKNIPPFIPEAGMPPGSNVIANIMFSPVHISKWDHISEWYFSLAEDRMKPTGKINQLVDTLLAGIEEETEKIKKIFEFVRNKVRYVAIEIGIGGFQPHFAEDILEKRYGDCKDMTTLIVAMAKVANIKVNPVLISTWANGSVDTSLVSHAHFNHAIAVANLKDSSKIWMDATNKFISFGELPWYDQNTLVLEIGDKGKPLFSKTPLSSDHKNMAESNWNISIEEDGLASGIVILKFSGAQANSIRYAIQLIHPVPVKTWFGQQLLKCFPDLEVNEVEVINHKEVSEPLSIKINFQISKLISPVGDKFTFNPGRLSAFDWNKLFAEQERKYDVEIGYPLSEIDEINLKYPESWSYISNIDGQHLISPYGKGEWQLKSVKKGSLNYKRSFSLDLIYIDKKDYKIFYSFLNKAAFNDEKVILFEKGE
ncbi:MAG: DUF3857 and transglutaminase domain-containing protein [Calditrichia bacterium]|nr:DUF3857 and transglutaminase domain-containing protein [Calditrichia bacterium]